MTTVRVGYSYDRACVVIARVREKDYVSISAYTLPVIEPANLMWSWPAFKLTPEAAERLLTAARSMAHAAGSRHPWQQAMPDPITLEV